MATSYTNFSVGNANLPPNYVAADGFVGSPASGFNPNSPTFNAPSFPNGASIAGNVSATAVVSPLVATPAAAPTIASATTIAPTTGIAFVSGVTAIATITPPSPISLGGGEITLIPTGLWSTTTAGNIALASTAVVSKALTLFYDVTTAKWYPSY